MLKKILTVVIVLFVSSTSYAAHPLITDDTGTQGKGNVQVEVNSEFSSDKETEDDVITKETGGELAAIASYGVADFIDVVLGLPYQWLKVREDGDTAVDEEGISDMSLEIKWRFYEKDGLSFALKPGISLPTGDEEKSLGNGKASYALTFITTKEIEPWVFHLNVGYMHNEFRFEEEKDSNRKDLLHASLASTVEVVKDLQIVVNVGAGKNPDKTSRTHPAFILGGLIYSVTENFDVDFGIKGGLTKPEMDLTVLAGMAVRF